MLDSMHVFVTVLLLVLFVEYLECRWNTQMLDSLNEFNKIVHHPKLSANDPRCFVKMWIDLTATRIHITSCREGTEQCLKSVWTVTFWCTLWAESCESMRSLDGSAKSHCELEILPGPEVQWKISVLGTILEVKTKVWKMWLWRKCDCYK